MPKIEYVKKLVEIILLIASFDLSSPPRLAARLRVIAPPKPKSNMVKYPMI
jgi:hypothetical protein